MSFQPDSRDTQSLRWILSQARNSSTLPRSSASMTRLSRKGFQVSAEATYSCHCDQQNVLSSLDDDLLFLFRLRIRRLLMPLTENKTKRKRPLTKRIGKALAKGMKRLKKEHPVCHSKQALDCFLTSALHYRWMFLSPKTSEQDCEDINQFELGFCYVIPKTTATKVLNSSFFSLALSHTFFFSHTLFLWDTHSLCFVVFLFFCDGRKCDRAKGWRKARIQTQAPEKLLWIPRSAIVQSNPDPTCYHPRSNYFKTIGNVH